MLGALQSQAVAEALPGVCSAGRLHAALTGRHQYPTLRYGAFMGVRLRGSDFTKLIFSLRLAAVCRLEAVNLQLESKDALRQWELFFFNV